MMIEDLTGKVAVITGGARGIGAATARALAGAGAQVVIGDVNEDGMKAVVDELGDTAVARYADVTKEADVAALVAEAMSSFGRLDILHNNAAIAVAEDLDVVSSTDDAWRKTFDFAVMASVWGIRHGIPEMTKNGGGSIINMSSGSAVMTAAVKAAYGSCKAAVESLTRYTAAQYGTEGVRCNAIRPGMVLTEGIKELFDEQYRQQTAAASSLDRMCTPEDVANVVRWLASSESGYINGTVITIDGGGVKPAMAW